MTWKHRRKRRGSRAVCAGECGTLRFWLVARGIGFAHVAISAISRRLDGHRAEVRRAGAPGASGAAVQASRSRIVVSDVDAGGNVRVNGDAWDDDNGRVSDSIESIGFQDLPPAACVALRGNRALMNSAWRFTRSRETGRCAVNVRHPAMTRQDLLRLNACPCFNKLMSEAGGFRLVFDDRRSTEQRAADSAAALGRAGA